MIRKMKFVPLTAAIIVLLFFLMTVVLPIYIRYKAIETIREATGRNVRIERVSFNPLTLTAGVRDFAVEEQGGGPFLSVGRLSVSVSPTSLFRRALVLSEVTIDSPSLRIVRTETNRFNFSDIPERQKKTEAKPKTAGLFPLVLNHFRLTNGSLDFDDRAVAGGRTHTVHNLEFLLPRLSTLASEAEEEAKPYLSMIVNGAPLTVSGKIKPFSVNLDSALHIALKKLSLPELEVYVPQRPSVDLVSGKLTLDADLHYRRLADGKPDIGAKGLVRLDDVDLNQEKGTPLLRLGSFEVRAADIKPLIGLFAVDLIALDHLELFFNKSGARPKEGAAAGGEGLNLARLQIDNANFDQRINRLDIGGIKLSGGSLALARDKEGKLSMPSLPPSRDKGHSVKGESSGPAKKTAVANKTADKPLDYHLKRIELDGINVAFTDRSRRKEARLSVRDIRLLLTDLAGKPGSKPAKIEFSSTFGKAAPLKFAGALSPNPFRYKGNLHIGRLPIRDFEAYYPENLNLRILDGRLDTTLALDIAAKGGGVTGRFKGNAGLGSFYSVDAVEEEDLLKWQRLQFDGINGDLKPFRLNIGKISLNQFYSRIIVRKDGTLNLQNLVAKEETKGEGEKPAQVPVAEEKPKAAEERKGEPQKIAIGAVTIANGMVAFTDKHLPNNFETTFYNLGGRISGLSSEASMLADVDLRGNLENHSPLSITGKINPLSKDLFVDLKLTFSDIELSPMSPYSETYLGYILKQGKLFIDMQYHIENRKLDSENKIRVDQFTFGDKVPSEKATSLPVKLGLALLKDRNGEINLDVPVTGRIDDPKFNIWRVVFQVLKNLLVKAATAPFSLISSMFAGQGDLSAIAFSPGSSALSPSEEKKLNALAKALEDRPALKVSLTAYVDRQRDAEGYRNELLERKLKREKFLTLAREGKAAAGEGAATMVLSAEERPTYLKMVYDKEKFPKPRNSLGMEIRLPDEEMVKLILANTQIGKDEFEALAREREKAVKNFLVSGGKVTADRIFEQKDDVFKLPAESETLKSRVELNAFAE